MTVQVISISLVIVSSILCSATQQVVSSTQAGQTLQIQPNVRKYNKHTVTEKPCTTGTTTTGTRKEKPENYSDSQDYVPIGGGGSSSGPAAYYPYGPYPYQPYQPGGSYPYRLQYPYEPASYPAEALPPGQVPFYAPPSPAQGPYYAPPPTAQGPYYAPPPYYPVAPYYPAAPSYHPTAFPAPPLYDQSPTIVDAFRSPAQPALPAEQPLQFNRQPVPYGLYAPQQPFSAAPPHFRAHAYNNRPAVTATPPFLQQRDAAGTTAIATTAAEPSQQYEPAQQQPGTFDSNQYHY